MKNEVKKSISLLQQLYMNGLIPYPRVSNDFEKQPFFELFPHPPLPKMISINQPLPYTNKVKINKKTSLLLLSLLKLVKPNSILKISTIIDYFFDESLEFINNEKKELFFKKLNILNNFLMEKNLTEKEILRLGNSFFKEENKDTSFNSIQLISLEKDSFFFRIKKSEKKHETNRYLFLKKKREEKAKKIEKEIKFKTLKEAVLYAKENRKNNINIGNEYELLSK